MAQIIDASEPQLGTGSVTMMQADAFNDTDPSVEALIIQGVGPISRDSPTRVQNSIFNEIIVVGEGGQQKLVKSNEGDQAFEGPCRFTGPEFGTVTLTGEDGTVAYFSPQLD